jgi:uncharacterized protein YigE (DUF2233 family)
MIKPLFLFSFLIFLSCGNKNSFSPGNSIDSISPTAINNPDSTSSTPTWKEIDKGLFLAEFDAPIKSSFGNSKITVLKINPAYYKFSLVSAKEKNEANKTAKGWAKEKGLIAVINAGMFRDDGKTNTGFMQNYSFINNNKLSSDKTVIAFNRKDTTFPEFQILDLECQDWEMMKTKYDSYSQGIRMIDCHGNNKWAQQDKKWSMVSIGIDKKGNVLFLFTRSPYSVHDFIDILLKLPIDIKSAQYLEGGPEASLFISDNNFTLEKFGSFETGFNEKDDNNEFWEIPNVIGISKK